MVGEPHHFEAVMIVDQTEVELKSRAGGQRVDLKLNALRLRPSPARSVRSPETHVKRPARTAERESGRLHSDDD